MVRLGSVALILVSLPSAAWSGPPDSGRTLPTRGFEMPRQFARSLVDGERHFGRAQIAPGAHFGFGMFGLKSEKSHLRPVTGRELDAPKQRRAAVGFSLRF